MVKYGPNRPLVIDPGLEAKAFADPNAPLDDLGKFIFYSKYSRWREDVNRREYWAETTQRSTEYNVNLAIDFLEKQGKDTEEMRKFHQEELNLLFENQFNLLQALSGRTLWVGGTPASYLFPISNFNCSFMVIDAWEKFGELIYLGMVGTGVGLRILRRDVAKLTPIKSRDFVMVHKPYVPLLPGQRHEYSSMTISHKRAVLIIGDSKEGWRRAVDLFFDAITNYDIDEMEIVYDSVRQKGERLRTFGGRAGGPDTIRGMFEKFDMIIKGTLDQDYPQIGEDGRIQPLHALDFANAIGKNIVSGDVRSIAEIVLLDPEDQATIDAKKDIFDKSQLNHRFVSNNSVFYETKPTDEQFDWQFDAIRFNGEPCYVNAEVDRRRRADFEGVNPCVEILLRDRGLCNLVTINLTKFVHDGKLNKTALRKAFALGARCALRMTLPTLELPEWDKVQQEDRLLGVSMTGYQDAMDAIGKGYDMDYQAELLRELKAVVRESADKYADLLGVNRPMLTTCVKPEGTQSQLFGGVSSGVHVSHAPYFIRRVRSSATDPMSNAIFDLGWRMHAEQSDGSAKAQLEDLLQYIPAIKTDDASFKINDYTHQNGVLYVDFTAEIEGDMARVLKTLQTMLNAYYEQEVTMMAEMVADRFNGARIHYTVKNLRYKDAFGKSTKVVVDFPQERPTKRTKSNFGAIEQLETYRLFLNNWAEHNPSNTISVRDHEWDDVKKWVKENWDDMLAVSFLSLDDTPYPLLPFTTTDKEEVYSLRASMREFDPAVLMRYDMGDDQELVDAGCETGACPVR